MKNKNIFLKIYIVFVIILAISIIVLYVLGKKERIGYLSDFEINVDKTLEINGLDLEETKKLFIIEDKLDETSINNFLFTNISIINYSYNFRIKYYNKVFRNSDIYGVYPNINQILENNNYIKKIEMNENGGPFGNLISSKVIDAEKIDNITYILKLKPMLLTYSIFIIFLTIYIKIRNIFNLKNIFHTDRDVIITIILIGFILFLFHFWLGFPGYFYNPDNIVILKQSILKDYSNWHPVIIAVILNLLYKIFGQHTFYLTLINLICLYSGLSLIIIALYLKYKNPQVLLLFCIAFISDMFFTTLTQLKDITCSMFIWLSISLIFFMILVPIKNIILNIIIRLIILVSLLLALLWRHNAIVTIYPIILFLIFLLVCKFNLKSKLKNVFLFISISFIAAILMVFIVKINPYIWIKSNDGYYYKDINYDDLYSKYGYVIDYEIWMDINDRFARNAPNNIFAMQISACAAANNDDSLIPSDWYEKGKDFEDLKKLYNSTSLFGDVFVFSHFPQRIFKPGYLENINKVWIKYILKYPKSYISHILKFANSVILSKNVWIIGSYHTYYIPKNLEELNFKNYNIEPNSVKISIYNFLHTFSIRLYNLFNIFISILIFFTSLFLIIKLRSFNKLLMYSFFVSFSSFATIIIVIIFTSLNDSRFLFPIVVMNFSLLVSFISYIYDIGLIKKYFI
ncbi:hypothetical protein [Brachyspira pilosicoli]|uniref:hypothetical protein n=2 Tax=Brachyspira pilosicoli TaxID=52584 RepID=UPI0012F4EF73|nr:hypothetical protein [Brachyspira pilosicoli]